MLEEYSKRRDFSRTPEPGARSAEPSHGSLRFVVQKHRARRLHYDFRLELDGVLKSWAVPNGPSLDPREKRLATMVEDHPLDYRTFEGVIHRGSYGAGQVIVWDAGIYSPDEGGHLSFGNPAEAEERMREALEKGKLSISLRGHKMQGSWTLVRMSRGPNDWLLIKHKDRYVDSDRDVLENDRSVQSGLTLEDLKGGLLPDPPGAVQDRFGKTTAFPSRLKPMMALTADQPFSHQEWIFEPKLDGFRVLAYLRGGKVTLQSRNGKSLTREFPAIVDELQALPEELVLDGEVVALNERGLPDFSLLQQQVAERSRISGHDAVPLIYHPFDVVYVNGRDVRAAPLLDRKRLLSQVVVPGEHIKLVEFAEEEGERFFQTATQLGLEGMVAKRRDSVYEVGARSRSWLKVKAVLSQEFVIGGYTKGEGSRASTFGALLLGYYEDNELRYAGKVGSGFDHSKLATLHKRLTRLETEECPFALDPELEGITNRWVRPELVARVKFANWTEERRLRAPVFLVLQPDLAPRSVVREAGEATASLVEAGQQLHSDVGDVNLAASAAVLEQLSGNQDGLLLDVAGYRISLTNLNKILWPAEHGMPPITKGDMVRYYARLGPVLLPHLRDRPLTFTRYPDGIYGESFYQKHWEHKPPEFVETVRIFSSSNEGDGDYILVNNLPTLVWLAQLAAIESHAWLSRTARKPDALHAGSTFSGSTEAIDGSVLSYPDFIAFDLDPYIYSGKEKKGEEPELNRRAFSRVVEVARALKEVLDQLSVSSFVKTSGKTGLHIYVPVLREYDYTLTRKTCETIGRFLMKQRPQDITMEWSVSKRTGKVFLDHNQNTRRKNMACVYSLRPLPGAPVSMPMRWDELDEIYPADFSIHTVPNRVERLGDLWTGILEAKHDLSRLLETGGL